MINDLEKHVINKKLDELNKETMKLINRMALWDKDEVKQILSQQNETYKRIINKLIDETR
ncbi:Uncharacterised protein [[Clostridium] sordellii]|uniref:hypothetical protein n=1 Tax=Paraclostridium sordellii TaxID=1505 RepID=UPI0005EA11F5|nr:hypothetical protein [Paeniclostridium sordellii]CEQ01646.1 Uncharacterised protein [[Clostridium] sordellii] [Paeniclostridium sordellii]